jgi:hypothetical protein
MKLEYDDNKSVYVIHKKLSRELFLKKIGVTSDSYAEEMFSRLYDCIYSELVDLQREYEEYYKMEYSDLYHFLYHKHNLSDDQVSILEKLLKQTSDYKVFRKEDFTYGDYGIEQFGFSETMGDRITNILLLKENADEN